MPPIKTPTTPRLAGVPAWRPPSGGINLQAAISAITGQGAATPEVAPAPESAPEPAPLPTAEPAGPQAKPVGGFLRYGARGTQILGKKAGPDQAPPKPRPPALPLVPFQRSPEPEPEPTPEPAPAPAAAPPDPVYVYAEPPVIESPRRIAKGRGRVGKAPPPPLLAAAPIDGNTLAMLALGGDPIPNPATVPRARVRDRGEDAEAPLKRAISVTVTEDDYALITAFGAAMYPVAKPNEVLRGWIKAQVDAIRKAQGGGLPRRNPW